ncbi:unnamed protein product [Paramecium pentaurelia]|uniref:Uncharacterized protein n=1 Tax=Paramecium pentaurelia TaxID=43138 RepID=A0A8S1SKA6_9CILI|nr:unnamed protein product [Paramecium pentaurelia]
MKASKKISSSRAHLQTKSFILNTLDKSQDSIVMKKSPSDNKLVQTQKAYIMIQPKLVEIFDDNKTKKTELHFENSISQLKTVQIIQVKGQDNKETSINSDRKSNRKESMKQSLRIITQL